MRFAHGADIALSIGTPEKAWEMSEKAMWESPIARQAGSAAGEMSPADRQPRAPSLRITSCSATKLFSITRIPRQNRHTGTP